MNALVPSSMSSTFRTPRVPEPPHDPTSLLVEQRGPAGGQACWSTSSSARTTVR